ncbi:hypothetical protein MFLAVUS_000167 [Mucor flavus]|uniref:RRM domain-containing protein n=1 Tax=Mucor flavus TaxID=439312 RepID=A0ABP9YIZ2_9FUNG
MDDKLTLDEKANMELDLELDAALAEPINDVQLVADEEIDRFEAMVRPTALFLQGVDDMSTKDITAYCNHVALEKVEWINDSSCNLAFSTEEQAQEALANLLTDTSSGVDHRALVPAKAFVDGEGKSHELFIRLSTDEDVKERGARQRSRYYLIHGVEEDKSISSERQEARKEHMERMRKSGGDGRSVFSRLGSKVERRRSVSPSRQETRSTGRDREGSAEREVSREREIPDSLKSRLGKVNQD